LFARRFFCNCESSGSPLLNCAGRGGGNRPRMGGMKGMNGDASLQQPWTLTVTVTAFADPFFLSAWVLSGER